MPDPYAYASFHVEDVVSDQQVIGAVPVGEAEEVYQEQPQESEVAEEDQEFGTDFANFYNTQGKHRCMINLVPFTTESYNYYSTYALSL